MLTRYQAWFFFFFSSFLAANSNRQALKFVLLFCLMHELLLTTALCVWHAKGDLQKFCPNFSIKKKILFQTFSEILIFFLCDFFSFFVSHLSLSLSLSLFFFFFFCLQQELTEKEKTNLLIDVKWSEVWGRRQSLWASTECQTLDTTTWTESNHETLVI